MKNEAKNRHARFPSLERVRTALERLSEGGIIIVQDDESRENEGDLVCALDHATPLNIAFMAAWGRGLVCAAIPEATASRLNLGPLVPGGRDAHGTAFTVSVDAVKGTSTGISAEDRARTAGVLADPSSRPEDLYRPGHLFPLTARAGGVLARRGHTEAAVDLSRLSGCRPGGLICEILNEDGTMARGPELETLSERWNMPLVTIEELVRYRELVGDVELRWGEARRLESLHGNFVVQTGLSEDPGCPEVIVLSSPVRTGTLPVVGLHNACIASESFASTGCDCRTHLDRSLAILGKRGGAVLYFRQTERSVEAFGADEDSLTCSSRHLERGYGVAVAALGRLGLQEFEVVTENFEELEKSEGAIS